MKDLKFKIGHPSLYNNFNGMISKYGVYFIIKIDKIIMREKIL